MRPVISEICEKTREICAKMREICEALCERRGATEPSSRAPRTTIPTHIGKTKLRHFTSELEGN